MNLIPVRVFLVVQEPEFSLPSAMHPYRRLEIWRRGRAAALETYRVTSEFPREERFGMVAQLRRATVSVVANVVEGAKRSSQRDFARFVNIAEGSAAEAGILFDLSGELAFGPLERVKALVAEYDEIERMLCAFRKRLEQ